jgi:hypothetical protein
VEVERIMFSLGSQPAGSDESMGQPETLLFNCSRHAERPRIRVNEG